MKLILLISFFFVLIFTFSVSAQNVVSGKIIDENGDTLPGVNVVIKGTTSGTVTDINGNYSLSVSEGAVLVISFVGYEAQEVIVDARSVIDITMGGVTALSEVVITAYGEDSRKTLTGSISTIDANVIQNQQVSSITRVLQGTVPGVNVIASSGQPGTSPTIRIRGQASIDSGNDPLIVVDGSPYSSNINTIPAADIESISVLKDASAAALYGSRAGNGVILITTKKGTSGGTPTIDLRVTSGVSSRARKDYKYVDAATAMRLEWETIRNDGIDAELPNPGQAATDGLLARVGYNPFGDIGSPIDANGNFVPNAGLLWNSDWESAIFTNKATRNEYNLGISGGSENIRYYVGGSILNQQGQIEKSDFTRYSGRVNLDLEITDWLSASLKQSTSSSKQNTPPQFGNSFSNNIQWIRTVSNIYPVFRRNPMGDFILDSSGNQIYDTGDNPGGALNTTRPVLSSANPAGQTRLNKSLAKRFFNTTNVALTGEFLENFTVKTSYQINKYVLDNFVYTNPLFGSAKTVIGRIRREKDISTEWTWTNSLSWSKNFGSHNVQVLLLHEMYDYTFEALNVSSTGLPFYGLFELNSATTLETIGGSTSQERIASLLGRGKYNYNNKYFVEFSYRQDESSRFSPANRKGNFLAVSGGWAISEESFFPNSVFNFLKLRGSWGQLGNNQILSEGFQSYFPYLTLYETGFNQPGVAGIYPDGLANSDLKWETVTTTNIGVDFSVLDDKLSGSVDVYKAVTTDLVTAQTTTISRGIRGNSIIQNVGDVTNSGIEVSLSSNILSKNDFNWSVSMNIAFEKNEITNFPEGKRINGSKLLKKGNSIFDFYIQDYVGVNSVNGNPMWWRDSIDVDDNIIIERYKTTEDYDSASRYNVGTSLPFARGGFSNTITYKGFDFSFLINFSLGGKVLDTDYQGLLQAGRRAGQQHSVDILNRWQQPGDITDVPRLGTALTSNSRSTRFLFDATYARLRNVTLGYTIPGLKKVTKNFVKNFRVFLSADNIITLFGRDGLDPEQSLNGLTNNRSAILKTYSGGLEIRF